MQQAQNMNQSTNRMMEPPPVVTVKDSLYITDMLAWNLLAMKKAHFFASQVQDSEIKDALNKTGQMHQRHYQKILQHLNKQGNQGNNFNQSQMTQ